MKQVLIIGGGAAGLMAAVSAAQHGAKVTILEKMKDIGRKILITGKGRCNLTNSCDIPELVKNMPGNGSFLYSAFHAFSNLDSIEFFNQAGLPTKVERGGRVFPVSDQAKDVIKAFARQLAKLDVAVKFGQPVKKLIVENGRAVGAATIDAEYRADAIIVTTGGASYPGTGSSGDGYRLAEAIGHTIIPLKPSLVPLEVEEEWITELQGLSLKNVTATVISDGKKAADEFGEMLFTHYGLSGPIIISLSKKVAELFVATPDKEVTIEINLKPALSMEILDKRLQRDFTKFAKKQLKNSLHELLPTKLIPVVIDLSFIDSDKFVHQITKEERSRLLDVLQHLTFTISKTRPVTEAIVTAGGVSTKEIDARTMESKLVDALFFAGEVIDIDGYTGGFNLQAAFSTGYVAGKYAAT
ncbi:3-dehydro-bile acid delta(4,6)-reductase [Sporomusa silvacetica DSM 10669]|uniref:3-dehydro-bile acid delta(4,6)-reductase n=1 Tax=Sporomusa silvacetica DSM 10669 TaxID=1123289 RepID=A0ABZ3IM19_9FIRM|nr:NAD(P)/FAD-dependent oxidoreductase [Sporomusa silvacetica]OZC23270.1 ferredoxin--NADP reductase [Sporomusa silvacetica DSM 10669]